MAAKSVRLLIILLLALAWLSPAQLVSAAASDTATFTFTSVTNPSLYLVDTTFQLSASGTNGTYPPFGDVTFYADGDKIPGCTGKSLNHVNYSITADTPATCTINTLSIGEHKISAYFVSKMPDLYDSANLILSPDHVVSYTPLTITPETLPDGQWGLGYSQIFSASGGDGSYMWSPVGALPDGFSLYSSTGELIGPTNTIGSSTFTVQVVDYAGGYATKAYTLNIGRATPIPNVMFMNAENVYVDTPVDLYIFAGFNHPSSNGSLILPAGTASYALDGVAMAACSGDNAKAVSMGSSETCTLNTTGLAAGVHTLTVDYTSTDEYYTNATGKATFTILPERYDITGMVFYDADKDGVKDETEGAADKGLNVIYDIDCNGDADRSAWSGNNTSGDGSFYFGMVDSGSSFCMTLELGDGETQTTTVGPLTLDGDKYFEIGMHYPRLIYDPLTLPLGYVNEPYSQTITISNGTAPYTISNVQYYLPDGITFNTETLTLSGTASAGYAGVLSFDVKDATGYIDNYSSNIVFQTEGTFTLTSSANPSASGEAVTFTYTGSGEGWVPYEGKMALYPPIGRVSFYADGVAIDSCQEMWLNMIWSEGPGNFPVTCTATALTDGAHVITTKYEDLTGGMFTGGDLTLTQQVGVPADTTPPAIVPTIDGTLGAGNWYTGNVSLTWAVTDAESEIQSQTGCESVSITSDQAATTYTCSATSIGGTASASATIQRDATKPATRVTGVTEGAIYLLGRVPAAGCATTDALSGVATEATVALSGGNWRGVGKITATCSGALDAAGNAADAAGVSYTVSLPADVRITNFDSRDPIKPGTYLTYTLVVRNASPSTVESITVTDTLDPMTTFVSVSKPRGWACTQASGVVTCTGPRLGRYDSATIRVTVMVKRNARMGTSLVNTASVSSAAYDIDMRNNSATQRTRIGR